MVQASPFVIELLEKIAAPFVTAIEEVSAGTAISDPEIATLLAQMLGQSVQASILLGSNMTLPTEEAQADSARLALTTLAGSIIAAFYRKNEKVPEEADVKRIVKSLQAVLPFSENFAAVSEQSSRLSLLGQDTLLFDELQLDLVLMQIMTPVILAIAEFSFGQSETKLLQEIIGKLKTHAQSLVTLSDNNNKLGEMMILKSLAQIYAQCHLVEIKRLMQVSDENRSELSLEGVWGLFDKRLAMVELIAGLSNPERDSVSEGQKSPPPVQLSEATVPSTPPPSEAKSSGGGPMSFFTPPSDSTEKETPAPTEEKAEIEAVASAEPEAEKKSNNGGGPMSFFKSEEKLIDDS